MCVSRRLHSFASGVCAAVRSRLAWGQPDAREAGHDHKEDVLQDVQRALIQLFLIASGFKKSLTCTFLAFQC